MSQSFRIGERAGKACGCRGEMEAWGARTDRVPEASAEQPPTGLVEGNGDVMVEDGFCCE